MNAPTVSVTVKVTCQTKNISSAYCYLLAWKCLSSTMTPRLKLFVGYVACKVVIPDRHGCSMTDESVRGNEMRVMMFASCLKVCCIMNFLSLLSRVQHFDESDVGGIWSRISSCAALQFDTSFHVKSKSTDGPRTRDLQAQAHASICWFNFAYCFHLINLDFFMIMILRPNCWLWATGTQTTQCLMILKSSFARRPGTDHIAKSTSFFISHERTF